MQPGFDAVESAAGRCTRTAQETQHRRWVEPDARACAVRSGRVRAIVVLSSDVGRTAQPFFEEFCFPVIEQCSPVRQGVAIPNALMHKKMGLSLLRGLFT